MAYKKRSFKRRPAVAKPWYMKRYNALELAGKAVQGVKYLKGLVNSETNYKDFEETPTAIPDSGVMFNISGIAQGDDIGQRSGNSVLLKSIYTNITGYINASATGSVVRCVCVMDKFNTGTAPTMADILTATSSAANQVNAPVNVDHTTRYKILYDKRFTLSINGSRVFTLTKYLNIKKHVKYTGPASTDYYNNNVWLLMVSNEATNTPSLNLLGRIGFHDN